MRIKFDGMSSSVGDIEKNEFDGTKIYLTVGVATVPFELDGPQSPSNPNSPGNQPELVNIACN